MISQNDPPPPSWLSRIFSPRSTAVVVVPEPGAPQLPAYDPFDQDPLDALPWGTPAEHSPVHNAPNFLDVTRDTLEATRQEVSRSLERDRDDPFFWRAARPDAVAGMARAFLRARCASRYWEAVVTANSYALWGAVLMAREQARSCSEPCGRVHLEALAWSDMGHQARSLGALDSCPRTRAELLRAEGLPIAGCWMGEAHKQAGLRALFAAALFERQVQWPDLPARLSAEDEVPNCLPALRIDLRTLQAEALVTTREEAQSFWSASFNSDQAELLWIPDWASWLLGPAGSSGLFKIAKGNLNP